MELISWGDVIPITTAVLKGERLQQLLDACTEHPDFEVVELRRIEGSSPFDAIVVDVGDGTVAPYNQAGIHRRERLALAFRPDQDMPPEVRALRAGFPATLHQHGVPLEEPRSLCLYEDSWSTVERSWTAQKHLRQILRWLEKTADGSLHAQDQALEQLFFSTGIHVVLPPSFFSTNETTSLRLQLTKAESPSTSLMLIASHEQIPAPQPLFPLQAISVQVSPVAHPPIQVPPHTLGQLEEQLNAMGTSLLAALGDVVRDSAKSGTTPESGDQRRKILMLVCVPRVLDGQWQRTDVRGFLLDADLGGLGIRMGILQQVSPVGPAFPYQQIGSFASDSAAAAEGIWRDISACPVDVRYATTRAIARSLSGVPDEGADFRGVLAGVGALGSAMADIWAREGWGYWDYIDPDTLQPHNLVRHTARAIDVGQSKVQIVRDLTDSTLAETHHDSKAIFANANVVGDVEVDAAISRADLLVDATTTLDVPRDWAERDVARTASVFITPSGLGAVLLLENSQRTIRSSSLEAQYYRALLRSPWGATHLSSEQRIRTGAGCRDQSFVLSDELIQLHASTLARRLRLKAGCDEAAIVIWTLDDTSGAISCETVATRPTRSQTSGSWEIRWDEGLEEDLRAMRQQALPSETGGILVGVIDHKLRTIDLVDAWSAPPDSLADETGFTRGKVNVAESLKACDETTRHMVGYVGDWHSHPQGCPNTPSSLDVELLGTLALSLANDGVPAVMVIIGEDGMGVSLAECCNIG